MNNDAGKISFESGLDLTGLDRDIKAAQDRFRELNGNVQKECSGIDGSIRNIGASIAAVFTVQKAGEFIKKMVAVRGEIESLEKSFGILAGTVQGKKLFEDIKDFAVKTPMTMPALAKGAQTLLAFNYEAENVMPILRAIGDISMGNEQKFNSLVLAFSQMSSTGKLMGQDLLQMINAGFNPLAVISEQTGKSIGVLKEEMAAGAISADMITKAFMDATSEGGKFNGMLEQQSKGIEGSLSNLEGAIQDMFNELGEKSQGVITSSIQNVTALVQNYEKVGRVIAELIGAYGLYKAALMGITAINNTATAAAHTQEAASLYQLLTAEQQASISKKGLSTASAEYYNLVKAETTANIEAAQIALVKAREEVTAASVTMKAKRGEYASAKQLEAQRIKELAEIKVTGNAKQIEAAQRKLNKAATDRETAGIAYQSATRDFHTKRTAVETAAKNANTLASNANTAAKSANATATNFLAVAKTKLTAVTKKLTAAVMKNPYAIAAAAVIALGFAIYKLATHQSEAEKAQSRLNKAFKEADKNIISERTQIDYLFGKLKAAKEGTEEYEAAKKQIINQYGSYLSGLSDEIQSLKDVEGAYKAITEAAKESAMARASEAYIKEEADNYASQISDIRDEVKKMMEEKFGTEKGYEYFWKIVPVLEGGDMTDEIRDIISQFDETEYIMSGSSSGMGVEAKEITTNDLKSQLTNAAKVRKVLNNAIEKANVMFGTTPQESKKEDEGNSEDTVKVPIYGVDYEEARKEWETAKKELQAIEKDKDNFTTKQYEDAKKREEEKKKAYSNLGGDVSEKSDKEDNKTAIQTADRLEKIANYKETVSREVRQAEFDIRQAEIDAMQEGVDKEIKQNELNYDRMIEANLRRQEDMVEALRDAKELEWENENPKAKEQGKTFDRSSVTVSDLSPEQLNILKEYERIAVEMRQKSNKDCIEKMLSDIMTYEQKRTEIAEEYEQKRKALYVDGDVNKGLKNGVTQGNVDELDLQEKNALTAIDEEFAQREVTYQTWCESIADMSLQQLQQVLAQAEEELKQLEQSGTADSKQLSVARAKVSTAKTKVEKANAKSKTSPDKRSIKEWNELREALEDCCGTFNELGDAVGGVAGDILSTTGSIMTSTLSVVNGIVQLVTMSATGMQGTATAAATAISTVEKASVILAVISAAIQIAMQIVNLFNTDKKKQEQIEKLQVQIDKLKKGYEELDRAINKAFSNDASKLIEQQNELLKQQKILIQQQINEEKSKKNPDDDVIKEWEEQIDEIDLQISDNKDKAIDAIFGEDLKSAIENFAEAYVEAWEDGSNKAQSAKDVVKKMMQQMVAESIKAAIQSSGKMEQIRQKLQEFYAGGILSGWEQDYIYNMAEELQKELDDQFGWADDLMSGNSDGQDSTKQGFATMSQDSADELNGRFTAIQIDTSNIKSLCDSILINTQFIVNAVVAMRQNSDEIKNLALVALDYLEAISRNTYELYEMNERLGKIEQNTRNL